MPRGGTCLALELFSPQSALGADQSYNRLSGKWTGAQSFGKNTLVGKVRLGTSVGGDMPFYDQFSLAGFQELSKHVHLLLSICSTTWSPPGVPAASSVPGRYFERPGVQARSGHWKKRVLFDTTTVITDGAGNA